MTARLVFALALLVLFGCGPSYDLAPVSGTVKVKGKAFPNAHLTFEPHSQEGKRPPASTGTTGADGRYTLTTIDGDTGAVVGKHRVLIVSSRSAPSTTSSDEDSPKKPKEVFPAKYNTQPNVERDVPLEGSDSMDFDVP
jgi:hypothetical protein